jgi:hypothetical protein
MESEVLMFVCYSILGCYVAWRLRNQSKLEWLSSNRTQKGQDTDESLPTSCRMNFIDTSCDY